MPTYQHLVPYFSGLLCGFFVHHFYVREVQLHKVSSGGPLQERRRRQTSSKNVSEILRYRCPSRSVTSCAWC